LQYFPPPEDAGVLRALTAVLRRIIAGSDPHKNVNKNNAQHAVVFEAIALALALEADAELLSAGVALLARFISVREPNIKYLGLENLVRLAEVPAVADTIARRAPAPPAPAPGPAGAALSARAPPLQAPAERDCEPARRGRVHPPPRPGPAVRHVQPRQRARHRGRAAALPGGAAPRRPGARARPPKPARAASAAVRRRWPTTACARSWCSRRRCWRSASTRTCAGTWT